MSRSLDRPPAGRWPKHVAVTGAVALGLGGLLLVSAAHVLRPAVPVRVRPVVFASTTARPVDADAPRGGGVTVQAPGWLEADPYYIAATALADGVVEAMLVLEGDAVEKGQVVARLVPDDARLARLRAVANLAAAEAGHLAAKAGLHAAQVDWDNPVERERAVGVGRATLAGTEAELAQLPALVEAEDAVRERLHEETQRALRAQEREAATDIEVIILQKRTAAQAASVEALRRREAILAAKRDRQRAEVIAAERNAELRVMERRALDMARAEVARSEAAVALAEAARDEAELRLDRMVIRAPISGFVQRRLTAPGDKVMMNMDTPYSAHVVHLYDPTHMQVRVDVPLADASHVSVGQTCEVVVEVLPDEVFAGVVTRITHEADLQKNTLQVKVAVRDPSPLLRPEMLTRVRFLPLGSGGSRGGGASSGTGDGDSVLVPADCLERDGGSGAGRVWAVRDRRGDRGTAVPVNVHIEAEAGGWCTVRGPLAAGELVVVVPAELSAGRAVTMTVARDEPGDAS